jgi:hypothetical protein
MRPASVNAVNMQRVPVFECEYQLMASGTARRSSQGEHSMDKSTTLKIRTISRAAAKDRELSRRLAHWKVSLPSW